MEDNSNKEGVRHYKKSALPRLRWTPELHDHFVAAVEHLGGKHEATPRRIVQMMGVRGLQMSHVKSHLQMYRSVKKRTTMDLVIPLKAHDNKAVEDVAWSPRRVSFGMHRKVGENQEEEKGKRKQPTRSTIERKILNIQQGKTINNSQGIQGWANIDMSRDKESEMAEFLHETLIGDHGKERSLWCVDDPLISNSTGSGYCFDLLLQPKEDTHLNLDLTISSYY